MKLPETFPSSIPVVLAALWMGACHNPGTLPSTADSEFSRLYEKGDSQALELARQPETLRTTQQRISRRTSLVRGKLAETSDEDEIDDLNEELEILAYLDTWVGNTLRANPGETEFLSVNVQAERMLNLLENDEAGSGKIHRFPDMLTGMLPTLIAGHRIPVGGRWNEPMGERAALLESSFLYDPERKSFYRKGELAAMTPDEVARLDVSPRHPAWHRRGNGPSDPVAVFEREMERGVAVALRADGDLPAGGAWSLSSSRRVLFMDKVYKSATSAKARVEDPFGAEWKIKWGDEVQSEPVSSRLYLMAGAKMTDLVFVGGGGPSEMIMILSEEGEYDEKDKEDREPWTVKQLAESLDDFYGFDINPYIHSHGVIDEGNAVTLLRHLPEAAPQRQNLSSLIGRHWVSFREYSLELKPEDFIRNLDAASLKDLAASEDRAARGLFLFGLWLAARDSKDDNNKTYLERNPEQASEKAIIAHYDGQHDLGVTLGALGSAARINALKTGNDFLRLSPSGRSIVGTETFVYKPRAYWRATWADTRWMAETIAGLSDRQLRQAVSTSQWPDFMQEVLFYKLAARRNQIARVYGIENKNFPDPPAPNISIDLSSPAKIREVEERYRLIPGSLHEELSRSGRSMSGQEVLVRDGEVVPSDESALVRLLVIQRHPAGLPDRYHRMFNRQPDALREKEKQSRFALPSRLR
ncbi:MAG: hypothetical protein ABJQ29_08770 [Luteolibacter sp.]